MWTITAPGPCAKRCPVRWPASHSQVEADRATGTPLRLLAPFGEHRLGLAQPLLGLIRYAICPVVGRTGVGLFLLGGLTCRRGLGELQAQGLDPVGRLSCARARIVAQTVMSPDRLEAER